MSELITRAITGAAYVALTLGAAWAGPFTTAMLFLPVCAIGAREFHRLYWHDAQGPLPLWSIMLACTVYVTVAAGARCEVARGILKAHGASIRDSVVPSSAY